MANKTADPVYISFQKLEKLLEEKGKKWQFLRDSGISPGIVAKMKGMYDTELPTWRYYGIHSK